MDLVLDFSTHEGAPWKRVSTRQARAARSKRKTAGGTGRDIGDDELDTLLGKSVPDAEEDLDLDCALTIE